MPIGGDNFNPFIMLEVHYNNPSRKSGNQLIINIFSAFHTLHIIDFIDSSGIRFYVSTILKQMDAGVIELGLEYTDKMAIPPKQETFSLTGYCTSACTAVVRILFLMFANVQKYSYMSHFIYSY